MRNASLLSLITLVAGCGGDLSVSDFQDQSEQLLCEHDVTCGVISPSDRDACIAGAKVQIARTSRVYSTDDAIAAGRLSIDQAKAKSCLDWLRTAPCYGADFPTDCLKTSKGLVAAGGACHSTGECAVGHCDGSNASGCAGTCKALPAIGEACTGECATGAYCDFTTTKCAATVAAGGPCATGNECADTLTCENKVCTAQTSPMLKVGDPCPGNSGICGPGIFCDRSTNPKGVCAAAAGKGAPCTTPYGCVDGTTCIGATATMTGIQPGTCQTWLDYGAACDPAAVFSGCLLSAKCDAQTKKCVSQRASVGSPCGNGVSCNTTFFGSYYCDAKSSTCMATPGSGDACDPTADKCSDGTRCDPTSKVCALKCG